MLADTALAQLKRHDPAHALPALGRVESESLRLRILSSPVPPRLRRRRLVLALAAAVGALALAGAGLALYESVLSTPQQVRDDFEAWTKRVPLPPGAHWRLPDLGETGLYGAKAGQLIATDQATCAWFAYWLDGFDAHDPGQVSAASAGIAKVRTLVPVHPAGAPEEAGGWTGQALRAYDRILQEQRAGDPFGTRRYLRANCS